MVVGRGVTLPMDKILKGLGAAKEAGVKNGVDFIMLFAIHKVREGSGKVRTMCGHFTIGR